MKNTINLLMVFFMLLTINSCKKETNNPTACVQSSLSAAQVGQTITFTSCSTGGETYQWNFGDGQNAAGASATHAFSAAGTYTVTLTATGPGGSGTATATITITGTTGAPYACIQASATSIHTGDTVTFTSCSNNATSYLWDFGDGSTAATSVATHVFSSAGKVTLTASNATGSDTATVDIAINGPGRSDFLGSYNCTDACTVSGTITYNTTITASGVNPAGIIIGNFSGYGESVNATINGNTITIPSQVINSVTVVGTGSINNAFTVITYTASFTALSGEAENCTGTLTKQ